MLMTAVERRAAGAASPAFGAPPRGPSTVHPAHRPAKAQAPIGDSTGPKVLVIDDDEVIREMIVKVLARENLVYQAGDGVAALSLLQRVGAVDVIVSDVMMPRLDGFEFARAVKSNPDLSAVPILFLTARGSPTDQVEGIQAGARSYLTKPFKVKDLLAAVARASRRGPR